jgi:hypothetical protein
MSKRISLWKLLSVSKGGSILKHNQVKRALIPCLILVFVMAQLLSIKPVAAQTSPPNLIITSNTQTLVAGVNNQVTFTIRNLGYTTATQTFVSLSLPSSPTTGAALMILNGSNGGKWYIGDLRYFNSSSDYYTMSVNIHVNPLAAYNTYPLVFTFSYVPAGSATATTDTRTLGMIVSGQPQAQFSVVSVYAPQIAPGDGADQITVSLRNTGKTAAQLTAFIMQPSDIFEPSTQGFFTTTSTIGVGTVSPGADINLTVAIQVNPNIQPGSYPLVLQATWTQLGTAQPFSQDITLMFHVQPSVFQIANGVLPPLLGVIAILILILLVLRRRARRAQQKTKEIEA